jgi:hypothetical protein
MLRDFGGAACADLNRGWRFCRQGRNVYLVDSSCFLVGPTPGFSLVFGRYCSQIVPNPASHPSPASVARSPEVLNQHQVGSTADEPAIENCLTIW